MNITSSNWNTNQLWEIYSYSEVNEFDYLFFINDKKLGKNRKMSSHNIFLYN